MAFILVRGQARHGIGRTVAGRLIFKPEKGKTNL
jgi:hypothetical protein